MNGFALAERSALLGTAQAPPAFDTGDDETTALVAGRPGETPERRILRTAAVLGTLRRAATPARALEVSVDAAPADLIPRCGPLAAADLRDILERRQPDVLGEWLQHAASYAKRCPEELLPSLLDRAAGASDVHDLVRAAIGARGTWLARQRSKWLPFAEAVDPFERFQESGDVAERVRALRSLRATDPVRGRESLEATWATEEPGNRARFLRALGTGLGPADEAFCEYARTDRSKDVRDAANALVHRLPASQGAARAASRANAMLARERSILGSKLVVTLPEACTPEMRADGIEVKPPPRMGQRAWWLQQSIAIVPFERWLERFDMSAVELFGLARRHEFSEALLAGFAQAIGAYGHAAALSTLIENACSDATYLESARIAVRSSRTRPCDEGPIVAALSAGTKGAFDLLSLTNSPWSVALSTAALRYARTVTSEKPTDFAEYAQRAASFEALAKAVHPGTPGILQGWPEQFAAPRMADIVSRFFEVVAFRISIAAHLKDGR